MVDAVEQVRKRLLRASGALQAHGVEYAIVGGNAVAAWVATLDEGAVRNTRDVDVLIRRADLADTKQALEAGGFVYRQVAGIDLFLDHADASVRQAVHLVYADEFVRPGEPSANPGVDEVTEFGSLRIINLDALVRIKLTAFCDKDRTHLRDLIDVGLLDQSWVATLPPKLAPRLQSILDTPDG